jgi:outer membrane protein, multidrug efflux system
MKSSLRLTVCVAALAAAACSTPVPVALKPGDVPQGFSGPVTTGAQVWPSKGWWGTFTSTELSGLEDKAQVNNLDLAAAMANVLAAQAQTGIAEAALFPDLSGTANASRSGGGKGGVPTQNNFSVQAQATYQADLWGEARDNLRAAEETLRSSQYSQETVALTVAAEVADEYFDVLALREEVAITKNNIDAAGRILSITRAKVTNGVSSNLDLAQQEATVDAQEAVLPVQEEQEREARYALAILEAVAPEGFDVAAQNLDGINSPAVAPGLPSELLERRPDIAQAEANLAAAHASVDAARAAFFPQITLTGSAGFASAMLSHLFNPSAFIWDIGASLLETIFNGGLHAAQSDLAKAQELGLIDTYRKAVLNAFSNTETELGQVAADAEQQKHLQDEVNAAAEAFRISELQYREGVTDLLSVLQAQQTLFTSETSLVQSKLAHLQALVGLYQALGGGFTVASTPIPHDANPFRLF